MNCLTGCRACDIRLKEALVLNDDFLGVEESEAIVDAAKSGNRPAEFIVAGALEICGEPLYEFWDLRSSGLSREAIASTLDAEQPLCIQAVEEIQRGALAAEGIVGESDGDVANLHPGAMTVVPHAQTQHV